MSSIPGLAQVMTSRPGIVTSCYDLASLSTPQMDMTKMGSPNPAWAEAQHPIWHGCSDSLLYSFGLLPRAIRALNFPKKLRLWNPTLAHGGRTPLWYTDTTTTQTTDRSSVALRMQAPNEVFGIVCTRDLSPLICLSTELSQVRHPLIYRNHGQTSLSEISTVTRWPSANETLTRLFCSTP